MEKLRRATHKGELHIGEIVIDCYVLEDGTRVLSQKATINALNIKEGGSKARTDRLSRFLGGERIKPFFSNDLLGRTQSFNFLAPRAKGGTIAKGYDPILLVEICEAVLDARKEGKLQKNQEKIAERCEILMRGFARVGIVALVDEATGYQEIRDKKALEKILDKYLLAEYAKWARRFPPEFYQEMFRLRNWQWNGISVKRPSVIGKYTNDIVYERLAPGVLTELRKKNPVREDGTRARKHHQWLTEDIGHPALNRHLWAVIALMRAAPTWAHFERMLERAFPKVGETLPLLLDE